jgi:hypothetical protein
MSDLFLDTETRCYVPHVARLCAESGYDDETLERIFWIEVFPEAIGNLCVLPGGEWGGLILDETMLSRRANAGKMPWLRRCLLGWLVKTQWRGVCALTSWLRPLNAPQRMQLFHTLRLCTRRYFETPAEPLLCTFEETTPELLADVWPRYEPICRSMLLRDEASTHEERAAAVRKMWLAAT